MLSNNGRTVPSRVQSSLETLLTLWSQANLEPEYIKQKNEASVIFRMFAVLAFVAVIHRIIDVTGFPESSVLLLMFMFRL